MKRKEVVRQVLLPGNTGALVALLSVSPHSSIFLRGLSTFTSCRSPTPHQHPQVFASIHIDTEHIWVKGKHCYGKTQNLFLHLKMPTFCHQQINARSTLWSEKSTEYNWYLNADLQLCKQTRPDDHEQAIIKTINGSESVGSKAQHI